MQPYASRDLMVSSIPSGDGYDGDAVLVVDCDGCTDDTKGNECSDFFTALFKPVDDADLKRLLGQLERVQ